MMVMADMPKLRGELKLDEPMAKHTSWRVGGPARQFYRPADLLDLSVFLHQLQPDEPILWIGLGSNLLVRDGGFDGAVIATQGRLNEMTLKEGGRLYVQAGVACAQVARRTAREGLCGATFLAGIPGTMGGALAMNAGAFGGETWSQVVRVEMINRDGRIIERVPEDFDIAYREVKVPADEWFVSCELQLSSGDATLEQAKIRELLDKRAETQPTGLPSGGSTFRNPDNDFAARLIEISGLKGHRIGGAEVSMKHANFLISNETATASDIEQLINFVQKKVERDQGVLLVPEVHIVGKQEKHRD